MPDEDLIRDVVNRIDEHTDDGGQGKPANQPAYGCDSKRILLWCHNGFRHNAFLTSVVSSVSLSTDRQRTLRKCISP